MALSKHPLSLSCFLDFAVLGVPSCDSSASVSVGITGGDTVLASSLYSGGIVRVILSCLSLAKRLLRSLICPLAWR